MDKNIKIWLMIGGFALSVLCSAAFYQSPAVAEADAKQVDAVDLARYLDLAEFYVPPPWRSADDSST